MVPLFLPANRTGIVTAGGNHYNSEELGGAISVRPFDVAEAMGAPNYCTSQRVNIHSDRSLVPEPTYFSPTLAAE